MSTAGVGTATIEELDGGLAAASANFTESTGTLVITVSSTSGEIGVDVNQAITVKVDADNDGRIRLTDTARKIEATSRP
jgi:pSer/pThr/pTyr-binding forkhead associated (FHA) protein